EVGLVDVVAVSLVAVARIHPVIAGQRVFKQALVDIGIGHVAHVLHCGSLLKTRRAAHTGEQPLLGTGQSSPVSCRYYCTSPCNESINPCPISLYNLGTTGTPPLCGVENTGS